MDGEEKTVQEEAHGLDDLMEELGKEEAEKAKAEQEEKEQAEQPSQSDMEKAKALASRMNDGFLWVVDKTVCPSVPIDDVADREKGVEAMLPLALEFGGEVPPFVLVLMKKYGPYIKAGVYMGSTIYAAKATEAAIQKALAEQGQADGNQ